MNVRRIAQFIAILFLIPTVSFAASSKPAIADAWLDLTVTYCIHAKSIWHSADVGGYWGDGVTKNNGNGEVRATVNTMLGYAMLIHAGDNGWLKQKQLDALRDAGLSRDQLLRYIKLDLAYLIAHHISTPDAREPKWGFSWQSTLWMGGAGPAALLVWKDLPDDLKRDFKRVAAAEADRIVNKPPKNYLPGDTGAEENAWDEHGPAVALALDPQNPHAAAWMKALKLYAVNVYSIKADQTSDAMIGTDKSRDIVHTANLFDDFTLENHGFFHPDYVQVSGEHLGESLLYLQMGDQLNGTKLANEFKPYAMHHLADVWQDVLRPLLLDDGEFTFPNGTDWTVNCSITPSYLACISTLLHDPIAAEAEMKLPIQAQRHRSLSPTGRILGDSNLEWWWEPLLIDRGCNAILQHEYRDAVHLPTEVGRPMGQIQSRYWPVAKTWMFRNESYFVSASWGARHMATFTSNLPTDDPVGTYLTVPVMGILPPQIESLIQQDIASNHRTVLIQCHDGTVAAIVCLPHSVLWISQSDFAPLGIENDKMSGGHHDLHDSGAVHHVESLSRQSLTLSGWVNIDDRLAMMDRSGVFKYATASRFNHRSVAFDSIEPQAGDQVWWMIPGIKHDQMTQQAREFKVSGSGDAPRIDLRDGPNGQRYTIWARFTSGHPASAKVEQR